MERPDRWMAYAMILSALCAGTSAGQDSPAARIADRLKVPLAAVPLLKKPVAMDAAPDFKGWAGPLTFQNLWGYGRKLPVETRGYLAADGKNVYMAIRCDDPMAKEIASAPVPPDGDVWAGDCVEFMLLTGYDPTGAYYHFAVNPAGSLYDAKGKDKSWDSGAKVFTTTDATGWLAVVRVPLAALGVKEGEAPAIWRVNLYRVRPARGGATALDLAWSPTGSDQSHMPARFGLVSLEKGQPSEAAALEAWMKSIPIDRNTTTAPAPRYLDAEHGIVCRLPKGERFSYFGWPTVARLEDGTLMVASSGLRAEHVCPFGKTVLNVSKDNGRTWSPPRVIQDSPIDDRDAGIVDLGKGRLLVSWFRSDTRIYAKDGWIPEAERATWEKVFAAWTDARVNELLGSWTMQSEDGGATWGLPVKAPVSAPHGPILLKDGRLLYLGRPMGLGVDPLKQTAEAWQSADGGKSWQLLGKVPAAKGAGVANNEEPHVLQLPDGRLIGMLRFEARGDNDPAVAAGHVHFRMYQTDSTDGGRTWSVPRSLGFHGSPPHLLRHSSGGLVLTYGYRQRPYGQRVAFSRDDGVTWDHDWILRDDGPDGDLGYPSTVELADGSLFTVYYQKAVAGEKASLLWSRWCLPAAPAKK